jgi:hypothetical protein
MIRIAWARAAEPPAYAGRAVSAHVGPRGRGAFSEYRSPENLGSDPTTHRDLEGQQRTDTGGRSACRLPLTPEMPFARLPQVSSILSGTR